MKKSVAFICIVLFLFLNIFTVSATSVNISIPNIAAKQGDIIEVPINISANSQIQAIGFELFYNTQNYEILSIEKGNILTGTAVVNADTFGKVVFSYASTNPLTKAGAILTLHIKVKNSADFGKDNFNLRITEIADSTFSNIDYTYNIGAITIIAPELDAPKWISIYSVGSDYIEFFWEPIEFATGYNIYVNGEKFNDVAIGENSYILYALNSNTDYSIQIATLNYETESSKSEVVNITTAKQKFFVVFTDWRYKGDYDWGESLVESYLVEEGDSVIAPEVPERPGYRFVSWDTDFSNVTSDLVIQAQYEPISCKVSFLDWDGTVLSEQMVNYGESAIAPTNPAREGYHFVCWNLEFDNVVSDLIVYAVYEEIGCTHENAVSINVKDSTCTEKGYSGDIYCETCDRILVVGSTLELIPHNYESVITAPTPSSQGYTTHTCTLCGDSYVDNYIDYVNPLVASGNCGTSANWELLSDGTLKITGSGSTKNYGTQQSVPWFAYASQIKRVEIADTITRIGHYSFYCVSNLESVTTNNAELTFGSYVFSGKTTFYALGAGALEEFIKTNSHTLIKPENPETVLNPQLIEATMNSITLKHLNGYEYSMDGVVWQDSNVFTNLFADTEYVFYQRIKEGVYKVSATSAETRFSTLGQIEKPSIQKIEGNTVTLVVKNGYEYSVDGKAWQSSNVFTNVGFDKIITFYQRLSGDNENISEATKCIIPSAPVVQLIGETKAVIKGIDGYEYSLDGVYWQSSNIFNMLVPEFDYVVYQRYAGTDVYTVISAETAFVTNGKDLNENPSANDLVTLVEELLQSENSNNLCFDYNGDGKINILDLARLKNFLVGKSVPLGSTAAAQTVEFLSQPVYLERKSTVA